MHPDFKVDLFSFIYVLGLLVKLTGFTGGFLLIRQNALANQRTILGGVPNSSQIQEVLERFLVTAYVLQFKSIEIVSVNLCRKFVAPMFILKYSPFKQSRYCKFPGGTHSKQYALEFTYNACC